MNINRNNYEEFFMLYADNELPAGVRKEVEAFVAANPDLKEELALFSATKLTPDNNTVFNNKEVLLRKENEAEAINITNYESFFVLYADDELNNDEKAQVEEFVYHHPQLQAAFELLQEVKLQPDTTIVFENKEILYRKEKDDKVIPIYWWRIAAAAIVLLIAGLLWIYMGDGNNAPKGIVKNVQQPVTNPQTVPLHKKEEIQQSSNQQNISEEKGSVAQVNQQEIIKTKAPKTTHDLFDQPKKENELNTSSNPQTKEVKNEQQQIAAVLPGEDGLKATAIPSIQNQTGKKTEINTDIAAAASKSVTNHQLVYTDANELESKKAIAEQVVATNTSDNVEVLNTSVETKSSLRGFFRKASRLMGKKSNNDDEDSKHKSILIGGFEIAVR
ncbi:MAG: hypothetical protein QM726_00575 [Chitinophagaceae bacterium]